MFYGAEGQNRTVDTSLFRAVLYQLSYLGIPEEFGRGSCLQDHRQKINSPSLAWRRGRDLNPRQAFDLCRFSKPVPSATRPPLRKPQTVCGSFAPRRPRLGLFHSKKGDHTPEHGSHSSNSRMILRFFQNRADGRRGAGAIVFRTLSGYR